MTTIETPRAVKDLVVVGHGMVGHRFVEALRSRSGGGNWRVTVLAEESDPAYDRVGLTSYTDGWDRSRLALPGNDYADDEQVRLMLSTRVEKVDLADKSVLAVDGQRYGYDTLVLATGSRAFVPRCPATTCPAVTSTGPWTIWTGSGPTSSACSKPVTPEPEW